MDQPNSWDGMQVECDHEAEVKVLREALLHLMTETRNYVEDTIDYPPTPLAEAMEHCYEVLNER